MGGRELVLARGDSIEQFLVVLVVEWREATQHDVQDYTYAPVVYFLAVSSTVYDFWGYVAWSSTSSGGQLIRTHESRETKVRDLDNGGLLLSFVKKVLWLKISVNDAIIMAVPDCINNRLNCVSSLFFRIVFLLHNPVEQLTTTHELDDQVEHRSLVIDLEELHDIGVVQFGEDLDLELKITLFVFAKGLPL